MEMVSPEEELKAALENMKAQAELSDTEPESTAVGESANSGDSAQTVVDISASGDFSSEEGMRRLASGPKSGKVTFIGERSTDKSDRTSHFFQTDNTDLIKVLNEMREKWGFNNSDKAFHLGISLVEFVASDEETKQTLNSLGFLPALKQAQKTTNAFLLSFGLSTIGGKAVGSLKQSCAEMWCLGVAPLKRSTVVEPKLVPDGAADEYMYSTQGSGFEARTFEPHHSAILVYDDGSRLDEWNDEKITRSLLRYRAELEDKLCAEHEGFDVPIVRLLFGDRLCLIDEAFKSVIENQIPVVVIKGSGKVADFFEVLMKGWPLKWSSKDEKLEYEVGLANYLTEHFEEDLPADDADRKDELIAEIVSRVDAFVAEAHFGMIVFCDTRQDPYELGSAVLTAVAALLRKPCRPFSDDGGYDALLCAFSDSEHKTDVLKLYADKKVNFNELFTFDRLKDFYSVLDLDTIEARLRLKVKSNSTLQIRLHKILCKLLKLDPKRHRTVYFSPEKPHDAPNAEGDSLLLVFVWAILRMDQNLAMTCWTIAGKTPMNAIIATMIYDSCLEFLVPKQDDEKKRKRFQAYKDQFEDVATDEAIQAFEQEPSRALQLIEKRYKLWGCYNCLQLAQCAEDERFETQTSFVLQQSWRQGLTCSPFGVFLGIFCPLYTIFFMKFDAEKFGYKKRKKFSWSEKLAHFYKTPITKFTIWALAYAAFVVIYSIFVLFGFRHRPTYWEYVVHLWFMFAMIESLRAAFVVAHVGRCVVLKKRAYFLTTVWRRAETAACVCHLTGLVLRIFPFTDTFEIARIMFSVTTTIQYFRLLEYCVVFRAFGPKLYVVLEIMPQVLHILLMLLTITTGYAVSSQSLIFPHRQIYSGILSDLLYHPYWQLFGAFDLEFSTKAMVPGCNGTSSVNENGHPCQLSAYALKALAIHLAVFLVFAMLLLNLLIAIFTLKIERVEENAVEIWRSQKWRLSFEFHDKSAFPPPLTIPCEIINFLSSKVRALSGRCCKRKRSSDSWYSIQTASLVDTETGAPNETTELLEPLDPDSLMKSASGEEKSEKRNGIGPVKAEGNGPELRIVVDNV